MLRLQCSSLRLPYRIGGCVKLLSYLHLMISLKIEYLAGWNGKLNYNITN